MKQNNIYLVGFMGSGKTSILKKIKQIVNANTIDLDENIEKKYGSISKIFQTKGEKYFRNIELETFQALPDNDTVIALGGGSLEVSHILDEVKNSELSFYLKDTFENLWKRISNSERPLVKKGKEEISELYKLRENLYNQSKHIIDIKNKKEKIIAETIIQNTLLKNEVI